MKTAVPIPDDLFHRADAFAAELGSSRSRLYREALAEYLLRYDEQSITQIALLERHRNGDPQAPRRAVAR